VAGNLGGRDSWLEALRQLLTRVYVVAEVPNVVGELVQTTVLLTSANLTNKAASDNLEAGLLIKGGDLGERLSRHIDDLRTNGILQPVG
jgi:phosphatidylserine/phosphatidylglycerophosphate/cardiolipin synthase-like enzyme